MEFLSSYNTPRIDGARVEERGEVGGVEGPMLGSAMCETLSDPRRVVGIFRGLQEPAVSRAADLANPGDALTRPFREIVSYV